VLLVALAVAWLPLFGHIAVSEVSFAIKTVRNRTSAFVSLELSSLLCCAELLHVGCQYGWQWHLVYSCTLSHHDANGPASVLPLCHCLTNPTATFSFVASRSCTVPKGRKKGEQQQQQQRINPVEEFGRQLEAAGFAKHGQETMISGVTGQEMPCDIYIGLVYYQRLRHMVSDKFQVGVVLLLATALCLY
jgi:hypothetical protein